ncbi:MAG: cation transporter [Caldilineaceae bacterium]|nr:cation transporter [Caldilineaceae bacterium]
MNVYGGIIVENTELVSTTFKVEKMDCTAEEQLVRLQLSEQQNVKHLAFNLPNRTVIVTHTGDSAPIARLLDALNLDATQVGQEQVDTIQPDASDRQQRNLLIIVLLINFGLFALELVTGFLAQSMGLVADSLDMLADAIVYALSLYAVGKAVIQKKRVARISGYFQLLLAVLGIIEVIRRFMGHGEEPNFTLMITISLFALAGNAASLWVLQRAQSQDVHMRASWIFTSNDVIVNIGVIVASVLVFMTGSNIPDLLVGAAVFVLVGTGAFRILKLAV